jgi:hypothetical protein
MQHKGQVERLVVLLSCLFVLWVCGEAGGALVLFVCTLCMWRGWWCSCPVCLYFISILYMTELKKRNKIVIHLIELKNRKWYYRYDIGVLIHSWFVVGPFRINKLIA